MGKFIVKENDEGMWWYHYQSDNGEIMVTSETYASKGHAHRGVDDLLDDLEDSLGFKIDHAPIQDA